MLSLVAGDLRRGLRPQRDSTIGAAHGGKQARDPYNIQSVNAFHSGLKRMVNSRFKGEPPST